MRNLRELDNFRMHTREIAELYGGWGDDTCGAFMIMSPIDRQPMIVLASSDLGWEHVSVSRKNRCPNWAEMEHVKRRFFLEDETAVQFHVPPSDHINLHSFCLHLWRPTDAELPRPPSWMVGGHARPRDLDDAARMVHGARQA